MILEKLHRAINNFNKTFNWRRFRCAAPGRKPAGVRRAVWHFFNPDLGCLLAVQNQLQPRSHCRCMGSAGVAGHFGQKGL